MYVRIVYNTVLIVLSIAMNDDLKYNNLMWNPLI